MPFWWAIGFAAAILVVLVVAVLSLLILLQARRIRGLALTAAQVVAQIDQNTRSIWALKATNETADALHEGAAAIEANAKRIEEAVVVEPQRSAA